MLYARVTNHQPIDFYCSLDEVHVCHSLARFQWKRSPGIWYKGVLFTLQHYTVLPTD